MLVTEEMNMPEIDLRRRMGRERLAVDQRFGQQIADSRFSRSEWGLIMTVVHFEVERPETPRDARLVADTSRVSDILPQLEKVRTQPMVSSNSRQAPNEPSTDSPSGIIGVLKGLLGGSGSGNDAVVRAAAELAQAYATELQRELETEGRWEEICDAAHSP